MYSQRSFFVRTSTKIKINEMILTSVFLKTVMRNSSSPEKTKKRQLQLQQVRALE